MRKKYLLGSFSLLIILGFVALLNLKVTMSQGINFQVSKIELPLYLKTLNFFHRHFSYKWLVNRVTSHLELEEDRIFRLFEWTHETIRPQPKNLPIMDDHVWNVYIRGYGVNDNFQDLFSTLCNYIGVDGIFYWLKNKDTDELKALSFVRVQRGWVVFDPFKGVFFTNDKGSWATIEEIKEQNWKLEKLGKTDISESFYVPFFGSLPNFDEIRYQRANIQSPLNRVKYQFSKWFSGKNLLFE